MRDAIFDFVARNLPYGSNGFDAVAALLKSGALILGFIMVLAGVLTWMERRQSAMMQDRLGPNRANIGRFRAWGLLHFVADAVKMIFKEDFVPPFANKLVYALAPMLAVAPVLIAVAIIPFGAPLCYGRMTDAVPLGTCAMPVDMQAARLDAGLLFYLAVASLAVYGAALAGWASRNKWALMGGLRASSQMMSYEVTMGMAIMTMFVLYGTLEPGAMVSAQGDWPWQWGLVNVDGVMLVPQLVAFLLFLTASIAEAKRTPFDIPEGESEIVGYFVEYSGMRFGMFYLGEFIEIITSSAVIVTVFFGGWRFPGATYLAAHWSNLAFVLVSIAVWSLKVVLFCAFQLLIRWTLPRLRADQLLRLGWQRLLPVSIANIALAASWILLRR
jgi:NADH-quinone oxidoreductase subunit H